MPVQQYFVFMFLKDYQGIHKLVVVKDYESALDSVTILYINTLNNFIS